ncbi:MAG: M23 family metallopeptidase [Gammaproteobacteria bacterium]|nr:M23 family metallopeptidase [Gammaproteobacteria bacterium]
MNFKYFIFAISLVFVTENLSASVVELNGNFIQGSLITGATLPGTQIIHDGKSVRVSKTGNFAIGFGRNNKPDSQLEVTFPDGSKLTKSLKVKQRQYKIQRIDGLPPSKVTPRKPEVLKRIRDEVAMVKKARKLDDPRLDFLEGFDWPLTGPISGVYGSQRILNGKPRRPHYGVDVAAPVGTPVRAPADGLVTLSHPDMFYSGGTMIIDHGHGVSSSFLHLSKVIAEKGQYVKRGDIVAEVGSKGRSSGPHLDWRINLFEKRLDPQLFAKPMQN